MVQDNKNKDATDFPIRIIAWQTWGLLALRNGSIKGGHSVEEEDMISGK